MIHDYLVIGGGILGLTVAHRLRQAHPDAAIVLLEKEDGYARHQTGHNSGVIHAGVYYTPGSLKATLCKAGANAIKDYCRMRGVPFEVPGKLIVATTPLEMERMAALEVRARENGLEPRRLGVGELSAAEPNIRGLGALHFASSGIVSYARICEALAQDLAADGVDLRLGRRVRAIREDADGVTVDTSGGGFRARRMIACAGLQADRVAQMAGFASDIRIVPFRGEYFALPEAKSDIVRHLIYPVPDPDLPFLGIHLTPMIDGRITVGPNAVLGFSREGYRKMSANPGDILSMVSYRGFWPLLRANLRTGLDEFRNSLWRPGYLRQCQKYCPSLRLSDLRPYPAGIRAQAVTPAGELVQDFAFEQSARMLHVLNAPSPAATSSFAIADLLVRKLDGAEAG